MQAQSTSLLPPLEVRAGVLVVDGYGIKLYVRGGRLIAEDGFADLRRSARFARATSGLRRVVVLGQAGFVTLEAIRWLADVGAAYMHVDRNGRVLATSGSPGVDHPALRRAQAKALGTELGCDITREILVRKIDGQIRLLERLPGGAEACEQVETALAALDGAGDPESLRALEARAALAYWTAWEGTLIEFVRADITKVPEHWRCFTRRGSGLAGNPRLATDPANAMLNYLYGLLEVEARIACVAVGLDSGIGVLHVDQRSRASLALDVMEAVRPEVDEYVLDLLSSHAFRSRDFHETRRGQCRLMPALTHVLAATCPSWAMSLGPVAERVAATLGEAAGLRVTDLPTPLTQDRRSAGRNGIRRGPRRAQPPRGVRLPATCRSCGAQLGVVRTFCDVCLERRRRKNLTTASARAAEKPAALRGQGRDPAHGGEAARRRANTLARRQREAMAFEAEHGTLPSREIFTRDIWPRLQDVPIRAMSEVTGLTRAYCSMIRRGLYVPHTRHWEALSALVHSRG